MKLEEIISKTGDAFTVGRAFGPPYERDGSVIIPVAWAAGGGGFGSAPGVAPAEGEAGGGGSGGVVFPLGVYVVRAGDVRWVPAVDMTRVVLAGLGLLRAAMKLRASRRLQRTS